MDRNDDVISGEDQVLLRPDFNALTFVTLWFKNVKSASSFELGVDLRPSWAHCLYAGLKATDRVLELGSRTGYRAG